MSQSGFLLIILFLASLPDSDFCKGFRKGWGRGWCHGELQCVPQVAPACPVPQAGKDSFEDGYDTGFVRGREAKVRFSR